MYQVIYTSTAKHPMEVGDLARLLQQARKKNSRIDVTGLLIYKNESFMQAFEGEEDTVRELYDTIKADERHHGVITLSQEPIDGRNFPDWTMGFRHLGDLDADELPEGFTEIMSSKFDPGTLDARPSYAREALLGFREAKL